MADPEEWSTMNIKSWIDWATKKFKLKPSPIFSRFPSTGRELVEMSRSEFWVCCAGSRDGGNKLAEYIAHSVYYATGRSISPLLQKEDPGTYSHILYHRLLQLFLMKMTLLSAMTAIN